MSPNLPVPSRTALNALRGLALGTSCSLILVAEERRRRLKFAQTLAENARLIKSHPRYNPAVEADLDAMLARYAQKSIMGGTEGDGRETQGRERRRVRGVETLDVRLEKESPASSPAPVWKWTVPLFPSMSANPDKKTMRVNYRPLGPEDRNPFAGFKRGTLLGMRGKGEKKEIYEEGEKEEEEEEGGEGEEAKVETANPFDATQAQTERRSILRQIRKLESICDAVPWLDHLPQDAVDMAREILSAVQRSGNIVSATRVLDILCCNNGVATEHLSGQDPAFILKCLLMSSSGNCLYDAEMRRPSRRFKLALFWFHHRRTAIRTSLSLTEEEKQARMQELVLALAECFSLPDADFDTQNFLAGFHVQFGRTMCSQKVVAPVANIYRSQGKTETLKRFLDVSRKAGVPLEASEIGHRLWREWREEDSQAKLTTTTGVTANIVTNLRLHLRQPLPYLKLRLVGHEAEIFSTMEEMSSKQDWKGVASSYSDALSKGINHAIKASEVCLRLAIEAVVELEGLHSDKALDMLQKAHLWGLKTDPITQSLLLARFNAIRDQKQRDYSQATDSAAYEGMRQLLLKVKPFYPTPSVIVYNRAIRTCIWTHEFDQAKALCLEHADINLGGDTLFTVQNFASLVLISALSKEYELLQRLMEALAWRQYKNHDICRRAIRMARQHIQSHMRRATTAEARQRHEDAFGFVEIAYQSILAGRSRRAQALKSSMKYEVLTALRTCETFPRYLRRLEPRHASVDQRRQPPNNAAVFAECPPSVANGICTEGAGYDG